MHLEITVWSFVVRNTVQLYCTNLQYQLVSVYTIYFISSFIHASSPLAVSLLIASFWILSLRYYRILFASFHKQPLPLLPQSLIIIIILRLSPLICTVHTLKSSSDTFYFLMIHSFSQSSMYVDFCLLLIHTCKSSIFSWFPFLTLGLFFSSSLNESQCQKIKIERQLEFWMNWKQLQHLFKFTVCVIIS